MSEYGGYDMESVSDDKESDREDMEVSQGENRREKKRKGAIRSDVSPSVSRKKKRLVFDTPEQTLDVNADMFDESMEDPTVERKEPEPEKNVAKYCMVVQCEADNYENFTKTQHGRLIHNFLHGNDVDDYLIVFHGRHTRQSPNKQHTWTGHDHLHIGFTTNKTYSMHKSYSYNALKNNIKLLYPQTNKYLPHLEKIRVTQAWVRYVLTPPRTLQAFNGSWFEYVNDILASNQNSDEPSLEKEKTQQKKSKNSQNLEFIIKIIRKFHCKHSGDISKLVHNSKLAKSEREQIYQCLASSDWNTIVQKALLIDQQRTESMSFNELLDEFAITKPELQNCLMLHQSETLLDNILNWHQIDRDEFFNAMYDVLNKDKPKKNMIVLQGSPNAGKSYIARSLLPIARYYAEIKPNSNNNFIYNDAANKNLVMMEEPCFADPNSIEEFKLIAEGHPTFVNRKNRDATLLQRTPVVVTTNNNIWRWQTNTKNAFLARGYFFKMQTPCDFLKHVHYGLHPLVWKTHFDRIKQQRHEQTMNVLRMTTDKLCFPDNRQEKQTNGQGTASSSTMPERIDRAEFDAQVLSSPQEHFTPIGSSTPIAQLFLDNADTGHYERRSEKDDFNSTDSGRSESLFGGTSFEITPDVSKQQISPAQPRSTDTASNSGSDRSGQNIGLDLQGQEVCEIPQRQHSSSTSPHQIPAEQNGRDHRTALGVETIDELTAALLDTTFILEEDSLCNDTMPPEIQFTNIDADGNIKEDYTDCSACMHNQLHATSPNLVSAICHLCQLSVKSCDCPFSHIIDFIENNQEHTHIVVPDIVSSF